MAAESLIEAVALLCAVAVVCQFSAPQSLHPEALVARWVRHLPKAAVHVAAGGTSMMQSPHHTRMTVGLKIDYSTMLSRNDRSQLLVRDDAQRKHDGAKADCEGRVYCVVIASAGQWPMLTPC